MTNRCNNPDCVDGVDGDEFETWTCPDCGIDFKDEINGGETLKVSGAATYAPDATGDQTLGALHSNDLADAQSQTVNQVPDEVEALPLPVKYALERLTCICVGKYDECDICKADAMIRDRFRAPDTIKGRRGVDEFLGIRAPVREPDGDALAIARELDRAVNAAAVALTAHDEPTADVRVDLLERARDALHEAAFGTAPARHDWCECGPDDCVGGRRDRCRFAYYRDRGIEPDPIETARPVEGDCSRCGGPVPLPNDRCLESGCPHFPPVGGETDLRNRIREQATEAIYEYENNPATLRSLTDTVLDAIDAALRSRQDAPECPRCGGPMLKVGPGYWTCADNANCAYPAPSTDEGGTE